MSNLNTEPATNEQGEGGPNWVRTALIVAAVGAIAVATVLEPMAAHLIREHLGGIFDPNWVPQPFPGQPGENGFIPPFEA